MFKGKALLVIDRVEATRPGGFQWEIQPFIQSINQEDPGGEVDEAFSFIMAYGHHEPPNAAYKMQIGDRIRVLVSFEMHFSRSYEGEYDSDMYITKERVLRRQLYNYKKYRRHFYNLWRSST